MSTFYKTGIALLLVFSSACSNGAAVPSPKVSRQPALTSTPSPTTLPHTPTSSPVHQHLIPDTLTPDTLICSPLAVQPLDTLSEIITQPFIAPSPVHNAEHPDWIQKDDGHHGVDLGYYTRAGKLFTGTPVLATLDGKIAAIIHDRPPYGNMLMVETSFERIPPALIASQNISSGNSLYTLYAHLQNLQPFTIGRPILCGQQLAETGLTGFTGGPHLHFEMRWGPAGKTFKSMAYYRADASADELANYESWRMSAIFHLFDPMQLLKPGK
jgi:murein DD-endopeptidase MepM/ murein hydrolase activator NlpD